MPRGSWHRGGAPLLLGPALMAGSGQEPEASAREAEQLGQIVREQGPGQELCFGSESVPLALACWSYRTHMGLVGLLGRGAGEKADICAACTFGEPGRVFRACGGGSGPGDQEKLVRPDHTCPA